MRFSHGLKDSSVLRLSGGSESRPSSTFTRRDDTCRPHRRCPRARSAFAFPPYRNDHSAGRRCRCATLLHTPDDGLGVFEVDDLFARQEERRAGGGAGEGEAAEAGFGEVCGEAEVGDFGEDRVGREGEEDVLRLQIAMDEALLVREGEALEGLEDDGAGQRSGQLAAVGGHEGVEAAAGAILHDEIENAFAGADIEDGLEVWMAERGGAADFAQEFIDAGLGDAVEGLVDPASLSTS